MCRAHQLLGKCWMQIQLGDGEERSAEVWQPAVLLPYKKANSLAAPQSLLPSAQQANVIQWKISFLKHFSVLPTVYELEGFWAHTRNTHPPRQWRPCSELEYKTLKQTKLRLTPAIQPVTSHCSLHSLFPCLQRKQCLPPSRMHSACDTEHSLLHAGAPWGGALAQEMQFFPKSSSAVQYRTGPEKDVQQAWFRQCFPVLQRCILLQFRESKQCA